MVNMVSNVTPITQINDNKGNKVPVEIFSYMYFMQSNKPGQFTPNNVRSSMSYVVCEGMLAVPRDTHVR